jgi:transcriptional regulator with XRE-family HTH domain
MSISQRLKVLRLKANQSLQDVADAVAASKAHIWELERGTSKNPSLELLQRLATHFKVTVSYLIDAESLGDAKAQSFFRKHEANLTKMTDEDLAYLGSLVERLSKSDGD